MKKLIFGLTVAVYAINSQAREPVVAFDSGLVTSVAITYSVDTSRADGCEVAVSNVAGADTRTLSLYCMDASNVTTLATFDAVTVASASTARVLIDPHYATTGTGVTRFQTEPCHGRTKVVLSSLTGKVAKLTLACHRQGNPY